ncbi:MAG: hypothetical protein KAU29_03590, partial [Gammaproteobacteria bacterium]|nr:hypothetical protein [Gammaproteobacteria bacterium]
CGFPRFDSLSQPLRTLKEPVATAEREMVTKWHHWFNLTSHNKEWSKPGNAQQTILSELNRGFIHATYEN